MDSLEPVQTVDEARSIAYAWAVSRGLTVTPYTKLAEDLFLERKHASPDKQSLEVFLQHFCNATTAASDVWADHASDSWSKQSQWTLETVKHLAIVNVGGLAGAAALLQKQSASTGMLISLLLFTLGLLMALLDFWLVSQGYFRRANDLDDREAETRYADSWKSLSEAQRPYADPGQKWFTAASRVGWLSALSSIAAGAMLISSIWLAQVSQ